MTTSWHVDDAALARWVEGTDGSVNGASVEQHLIGCAECRARVPAEPVVDAVWTRVQDVVELPRETLLERLLRRTGLSAADARIVAVSPSFRGSWLVGLSVLLAFASLAASGGLRGQWVFLVVAPLVPALGVALGYDPELDEALDQECATPYPALRLILLRTVALLVAALPALLVVSLLMPSHIAFLWLAPAAGCTAVVLALSIWVAPLTAVGVVGSGWVLVVSTVARHGRATEVLASRFLAVYAAVAVVAVLLVVVRGRALSRVTWRVR